MINLDYKIKQLTASLTTTFRTCSSNYNATWYKVLR